MRPSPSPASAILLAALGIGLLSLMDATIKGLSDRYGVTGIAFSRYLVGTVVMAAVLAVLRPGWPSAETWRTNGLRAVLVVVTALCFFHGLSVLPLAEALALSFLSPIFIALFAALLLRDGCARPSGPASVVGFLASGSWWRGRSAPTRRGRRALRLGHRRHPGLGAHLRALDGAAARPRPPRPGGDHRGDPECRPRRDAGRARGLDLDPGGRPRLGAPRPRRRARRRAGHLVLSRAYAKAEASRLAAMETPALLWAIGLGYLAFGEVHRGGDAGGCGADPGRVGAGGAAVTGRRAGSTNGPARSGSRIYLRAIT